MRASRDTKILVADDEAQIRRTLQAALSNAGYDVFQARNGEEAIAAVTRERPDVVLLDINLPDLSGVEVCCRIRRSFKGPILMVTVRQAEHDKIAALDAGADDFIVKPFSMGELLARIRATLRRFTPEQPLRKIDLPGLTIDFERRMVDVRGARAYLTPREFDVLHVLAVQQGKPVTYEKLLREVWGPDHREATENLRVVIKQLRKKIEKDPSDPRYIITQPWTGYRLEVPDASASKLAPGKKASPET
jgi:two-component system, OmpR family, KDP operon response regulator KdpE